MTKKFTGLFGSSRWLMERQALRTLVDKMEGLTPEGLQQAEAAARAYAPSKDPTMVGDVAVIPVCGPIFYRPSWYAMYFGGAIISSIRAQFRTAVNDPNVKAIVFPFDSPGGIIDMVPEFAKELFAARGQKPMVAVADTMIASAAYWLASQMDQIFVTESSRVGSIGVYVEHDDISAMLEQAGVKVTLIAYGEHKVDGNPYEPLSDAVRAKIQEDVNRSGEKFTKAVAAGRGVSKNVVLDTFGQGQMFDGDQAIAIGMADKLGAFDQVIVRAGKGKTTRATVDERTVFVLGEVLAETNDEPADTVDPDDDGNCPDGYEIGDDNLCSLIGGIAHTARLRAKAQADADLTSTTVAITSARR